ncbi:MAG: FHA domain-containing protein, partial [Microcystaceae cyanobacterium]
MDHLQELRHILVIEDQKSRRIVSLKENTYSLGRDPSNSILIYDRQVSRYHATLLRINDYQSNDYSYRIIDGNLQGKKSTNGLSINGKYCLSHELKQGDIIHFGGKAKIKYHITSQDSEFDLFKANEPQEKSIFAASLKANQNEEEHHTIVFGKPAEENSKEILINSYSLAEFSPNPILEIDFEGQITYLNPSASLKFQDIREMQQEHPLVKGLLTQPQNKDGTSFIREVHVGQDIFEQHIHYLAESQLIRSYLFDITKSKQLEAALNLSQSRSNLLYQQTTEGIIFVDAATKRIIEANHTY